MSKLIKTGVGLVLALILLITGGLVYVKTALPNVGPAPDLKVEITPERVERGKYLANYVMMCIDCHSTRDWAKFSGPMVDGTEGKGGEFFGADVGLPGNYYSKNLTPYHIGEWTDGELFRAITAGVNKDGDALFPIMPYLNFGKADKEDIYDIIAYLRTLEPIEYDVPASNSGFPMNFIINTMPQQPAFTTRPERTNRVAYGEYLVTVGSCRDCHTQQVNGAPVMELDLAGGFTFVLPSGDVVNSANITPHNATGIGEWSEAQFVERFKSYADSANALPQTPAGTFNTPMPWSMYGHMDEDDLRAIYAYLRTVPAIENRVTLFAPATNQ